MNYSNQKLDFVASVLGWALVIFLLCAAIVVDCATNQARGNIMVFDIYDEESGRTIEIEAESLEEAIEKSEGMSFDQGKVPITRINCLDHLSCDEIATDDHGNQYENPCGTIGGTKWSVWRDGKWNTIDTSAANGMLSVWNCGDLFEDWKDHPNAKLVSPKPDAGNYLLDLLHQYQTKGISPSVIYSIFSEAERGASREPDQDLSHSRYLGAVRQTEAIYTLHEYVPHFMEMQRYTFVECLSVPRQASETKDGLVSAPFTMQALGLAYSRIIRDLERRIKRYKGKRIECDLLYDLCQYRRQRAVFRMFGRRVNHSGPTPTLALSVRLKD